MPYFVFNDGKNIHNHIKDPGFKLLYFGKGDAAFEKLQATRFPISTFAFREIPKKLFQNAAEFYVLLRPDNHIVYVGKEIQRCNEFLKGL